MAKKTKPPKIKLILKSSPDDLDYAIMDAETKVIRRAVTYIEHPQLVCYVRLRKAVEAYKRFVKKYERTLPKPPSRMDMQRFAKEAT